jgi:putative tetratricopeptide repeat-containing domain protein
MSKLEIIKDDLVTIEDRNYFNNQIDLIINQHKDNRQTINRLVFDSISCLTEADRDSNTLTNKGFFKRLIGNFTGSNKKLERSINNNRGKAQYLAQQTLQKLAEQNLLSFDLISAVNNKLNNHIEMVNHEFEEIYNGLNKFFKLYQNNLLQTELRLDNLERNVNLLTWVSSIEYQMFNEVSYLELDKLSKIICITRDFYEITKGDWSTSDLLLLKSVLSQLSLSPSDEINLWNTIIEIQDCKELYYKLFGDNIIRVSNEITDSGLVVFEALYKLNRYLNEDKYEVLSCIELITSRNTDIKHIDVAKSLTKSYINFNDNFNIDCNITIFDFILEILFNLNQGASYIITENFLSITEIDDNKLIGQCVDDLDSISYKSYESVNMYLEGQYDDSFILLKEEYDQGDYTNIFYLAASYLYGRGTNIDYETCFDLIDIAIENNNHEVYFLLGKLYTGALGCNQDKIKGAECYKKVIELVENSYIKGMALNNLGLMYQSGDGVELNIEEAISLFRQGTDCCNSLSAYNLGMIYFNGNGVKQNYDLAFKYFKIGADKNQPLALNMLGYIYEKGLVKNVAYRKAMDCYKRAYENGLKLGAYNYARFFENGVVVEQDFEVAFKYYYAAWEESNPMALNKIKTCYWNGFGVPQNRDKGDEVHALITRIHGWDLLDSPVTGYFENCRLGCWGLDKPRI